MARWLASLVLLAGAFVGRSRDVSKHEAVDIRASLYFQEAGQFGTDNIVAGDSEAPPLHHALTGGFHGQGPSGATLVLVKVRGTFASSSQRGSVRLTAKPGDRILADRSAQLSDFYSAERTEIWIPFLVYGTGCGGELKLTASTRSPQQNVESTVTRAIAFDCSE